MNMTEMIKRSFEIRETDAEKREVTGIAVPYDESFDLGNGKFERFAKGAVDTTSHVKLFRDHEQIIGVVTEMNDSDAGLEIRAKISETILGNETLNLVKDGAIRSFSVGFIPLEEKTDGNTIIRTKVELKEVSLVPFPAYTKAEVVSVREEKHQEDKSMENTTPDLVSQITEVRNHAEELERRLEVITSEKTATSPIANFRSYGDYVKAVAAGTEDGLAAHRAFGDTNSILTDTVMLNPFVANTINILNKGRPTYSVFSSAALPDSGMNVEFPKITTDTTQVTEQAAVGDTLAFGKINLETATAAVKTYGGYTGMAKQVIDRSSVAYVDAAFRSLVAAYAKATNQAARTAIGAAAAATSTNLVTVAGVDADDIVDAIAEAALKVNDDTGLPLEFMLMSSDAFRQLAKVVDSAGRPILSNQGAVVNSYGSINPVGLSGTVLGLPIVVDPSLTGWYAGNSAAFTMFESAGAPFRLTDEDVVELSNKLSVYGYLAIAGIQPKALVKFI